MRNSDDVTIVDIVYNYGENGHVQHAWDYKTLSEEKVTQFYFQLVRSKDHSELEKILNENNIKCFSVSSVKKGVEALEKYNDNYVKIIFGSHYIAEEVYTATGKHFDTTNN